LLEGEAEAVTRAVVDKAKSGELAAAKIILDRILPPRRDRPVVFTVPKIEKAADALTASAAIVEAVASGELRVRQESTARSERLLGAIV
jgi:hypothetical protein